MGQLFTNVTFIKNIGKIFSETIKVTSFQEVRLHALIRKVYNGITNDDRWTKTKNTFYNFLYGRQSKYNLKILYNVFKSKHIRSLSFKDSISVEGRYKLNRIREHINLINYAYSDEKCSSYITNMNIYNYVRPKLSVVVGNKRRSSRFFDVPYYEGNPAISNTKYYNIPEYDSDDEWTLHLFDFFDPRFWAISDSWFTGFHPDDRRKMRPLFSLPLGFTIFSFFTIPLVAVFPLAAFIPIPILIPSDFFSLTQWGWEWLLRANVTREFLPFLEDYYEPPNIEACLPPLPLLPDPEFGCKPPEFELAAPIFPRENYTDLFKIEFTEYGIPYLPFCLPYRNPFMALIWIIQLIFTPLLGPILGDLPAIEFINDFLDDTLGFGFISNTTGGQGTDALPVGLWQCLLPQLPFLILVAFIILAIFSVFCFSCLGYCRDTIVASETMNQRNMIDDLKQAVYENEEVKKLIGYLSLYNLNQIIKLKKSD